MRIELKECCNYFKFKCLTLFEKICGPKNASKVLGYRLPVTSYPLSSSRALLSNFLFLSNSESSLKRPNHLFQLHKLSWWNERTLFLPACFNLKGEWTQLSFVVGSPGCGRIKTLIKKDERETEREWKRKRKRPRERESARRGGFEARMQHEIMNNKTASFRTPFRFIAVGRKPPINLLRNLMRGRLIEKFKVAECC